MQGKGASGGGERGGHGDQRCDTDAAGRQEGRAGMIAQFEIIGRSGRGNALAGLKPVHLHGTALTAVLALNRDAPGGGGARVARPVDQRIGPFARRAQIEIQVRPGGMGGQPGAG